MQNRHGLFQRPLVVRCGCVTRPPCGLPSPMDRFVTRTPREKHLVKHSPAKQAGRQVSLHSLAGVVVVEDLQRARRILEDPQEDRLRKLEVLGELLGKRPSTALISEVGIGRTVRRISEGKGVRRVLAERSQQEKEQEARSDQEEDQEVRQLARRVYRRWKEAVEKTVELSHRKIEVRCDKVSSEHIRRMLK